ncbi:MAG: ABC transporter ATP-binding protein [Tissierellia bacterium]|nr:ABC transporter ATP-binding protein [Tissierellia bacterium]
MNKNNNKPQGISKSIFRLLKYVFEYKILMIITILCVIISTLTNIFGVALIQPIIDNYILKNDISGLLSMIIKLSLIYLVSVVTSVLYARIMVRIAESVTRNLRDNLFTKIQDLPLDFFDHNNHGEIMSRFTNDVDIIDQALGNSLTNIIQSILLFVGLVAMMIYMNIRLFLITFVFLIIMLVFTKGLITKSAQYYSTQQKRLGHLNGFIEEMLQGQKVVKIFNYENEAIKKYDKNNENLRQAGTRATINSGRLMPILNNLSNIDYAVTCIIGAVMTISGSLTIGTLAVFLSYCRQVQRPIATIAQQANVILQALAGAKRIFEILDLESEEDKGKIDLVRCRVSENGKISKTDKLTGRWAWVKSNDGEDELKPLSGDIKFENVNFSYDGKNPILKNISFHAKPGQKIAFVGSTGAGKTTITNLITRFYDIDSGKIYIDGIDVFNIKKSALRRAFGMVLQDTSVFSDTIKNNIRYARVDATDEEIEVAAKIANAKSFIDRLPDGFNTFIEGNGSSLSQGQSQLISIARAAVAEPSMLILDEATSSIDSETEKVVTEAMDNLMIGRTTLVIAHRLSTIRNSDVIMVMDDGEIIERGSHDELIKKGGRYYELYTGKIELD